MDSSSPLLRLFWDLASLECELREAAVLSIRKMVNDIQIGFLEAIPADQRDLMESSPITDISEEQIESYYHPEVLYCAKRLIKGLSSDRKGARQGFATAMVEIIQIMNRVPANIWIKWVQNFTEYSNGMKGSEIRSFIYGRIFGYAAIMKSGLLKTNDESLVTAKSMVDEILAFASKKPYLREICYVIVFDLIMSCQYPKKMCSSLISSVESKEVSCCEELALMCRIQSAFPDEKFEMKYEGFLDAQNLLSSVNLPAIAEVLKESHAFCHPKLNSCWSIILDNVFKQVHETKSHKLLQDFWLDIVEKTLFESGSLERKYVGFRVFELTLPKMVDLGAPTAILFSPNFMRTLLKSLSESQSSLYKICRATVNFVIKNAEDNRRLALEFASALTGAKQFSHVALQKIQSALKNEQIIEDILTAGFGNQNSEDFEGIREYIGWISGSFKDQSGAQTLIKGSGHEIMDIDDVESENKSNPAENYRRWCIDQLASLLRNKKVPRSKNWMIPIVKFFSFYANFKPLDQTSEWYCNPAISEKIIDLMRKRFWSILADICAGSETPNDVLTTLRTVNDFLVQIEKDCVIHTRKSGKKLKLKNYPEFTRHDNLHSEARVELKRKEKLVDELLVKLENFSLSENQRGAIGSLMLLLIIQAKFSFDQSEIDEIDENLQELIICVQQLANEDKKSTMNPLSVITDIFVSFLAKNPEDSQSEYSIAQTVGPHSIRLTRLLTNNAFKFFCREMPLESADILMRVIDPRLEFKSDSKEEQYSKEMENDDVESSSEDLSSIDDDSNTDQSSVDYELIKKLEDINDENSSKEHEEENLNDEEMISMGFDAKLAEIFKNRKMEKKQKEETVKAALSFKFRVLDLLDIWIHEINKNSACNLPQLLSICSSLMSAALCWASPGQLLSHSKFLKRNAEDDGKSKLQDFISQINVEILQIPSSHRQKLLNKLTNLLKKISKTQVLFSSENNDSEFSSEIFQTLTDLVYYLSGKNSAYIEGFKPKNDLPVPNAPKELQSVNSSLIFWLVKLMIQHEKSCGRDEDMKNIVQNLTDLYGKTFLEMFLTKNSSRGRLPISVFVEFIQRNPFSNSPEYSKSGVWKVIAKPVIDALISGENLNTFQTFKLWAILDKFISHLNHQDKNFWKNYIYPNFSEVVRVVKKRVAGSFNDSQQKAMTGRMKEINSTVSTASRKLKKAFNSSLFFPEDITA